MLKVIWNLISFILVFECAASISACDVDIGRLRGVYAMHKKDIGTFVEQAPSKYGMISDENSYRTKSSAQVVLNDLNLFFYGTDLDFLSVYRNQNPRVSIYSTILEAIKGHVRGDLPLLQVLSESDLFEDELWSLAQFQIMCHVMSDWYESSLATYFDVQEKRGTLSRPLGLKCPKGNEAELVDHLLKVRMSEDPLGEMMEFVERLKKE